MRIAGTTTGIGVKQDKAVEADDVHRGAPHAPVSGVSSRRALFPDSYESRNGGCARSEPQESTIIPRPERIVLWAAPLEIRAMDSSADRFGRRSTRKMRRVNATVRDPRRWLPAVERLEDYVLMATYTVINTADHGGSGFSGSFRYCWNQIAQTKVPGEIDFAIPTSDANYNATKKTWTISLTQDPPASASGKMLTMDTQVTVNGWTQGDTNGVTNYQGIPLIVFDGSLVPGINLLDLGTMNNGGAGGSIIEGLSIVNFTLNSGPNTDSPNGGVAIIVEPTSPNVQILGNYLGVEPDGSGGVTVGPNAVGVAADAAGLTIGGTATVDRNIISGNTIAGVAIATLPSTFDVTEFGFTVTIPVGGVPATDDVIENNFIGTDNTGESDTAQGTATGNTYGVALGGTIRARR